MFYTLSSGNQLSWVPLFIIRGARILIHLIAVDYDTDEFKQKEKDFRKCSAFVYPFIGLAVTYIGGKVQTCRKYWTGADCLTTYVIVMAVLLLINACCDYYIWTKIFSDKRSPAIEPKPLTPWVVEKFLNLFRTFLGVVEKFLNLFRTFLGKEV